MPVLSNVSRKNCEGGVEVGYLYDGERLGHVFPSITDAKEWLADKDLNSDEGTVRELLLKLLYRAWIANDPQQNLSWFNGKVITLNLTQAQGNIIKITQA